MSVLIPDKLVFYAHDHTCSDQVEAVLRAYGAVDGDEDVYKIATVRNPYELMVFLSKEYSSLEECILDQPENLFPHQNDVDFVMFYEYLEGAFNDVLLSMQLPVCKLRVHSVDFRDSYDSRTKALVEQLYGREIRKYGYRFPLS